MQLIIMLHFGVAFSVCIFLFICIYIKSIDHTFKFIKNKPAHALK